MKRKIAVFQAIAATLGLSLLWSALPAKAYPELQYEHLNLSASLERCASSAHFVLQHEGFRRVERRPYAVVGYQREVKAVIDCNPLAANLTQATIMVAAESESKPEVFHLVQNLHDTLAHHISTGKFPV